MQDVALDWQKPDLRTPARGDRFGLKVPFGQVAPRADWLRMFTEALKSQAREVRGAWGKITVTSQGVQVDALGEGSQLALREYLDSVIARTNEAYARGEEKLRERVQVEDDERDRRRKIAEKMAEDLRRGNAA